MSTSTFISPQASVARLVVSSMQNNVFVIRCEQTGNSVVIDAADDAKTIITADTYDTAATERPAKTVLQTHGHWDHIRAVNDMREAGYRVGIGTHDAAALDAYDFAIGDDEVFDVGTLRVRAIATPGHTPGSFCFHVENTGVIFSGDTLFKDGPGATHFPGGDFPTIMKSIETRLFDVFDDDTIVWPGHGDSTTIGWEKSNWDRWRAML